MNFKLNTLVAAVVLSATAMSASAAIDSNSGNSEFIFSAWDADAGVGYTYDLNWNKFLNDFIGVDQAASAAGNALLAANAKVSASLIGANGVIFDDVLTGLPFSGASLANAQWNLTAFDNVGRTRVLVTQGDDGLPFAQTNNQAKAVATALSVYAPNSNGFIVGGPVEDGYALTVQADGSGYAGISGNNFVNNTVDTTNAFGGSSNIFLLAPTTQASSAAASFVQQLTSVSGDAIVARTYLQDGAWRLNISAVTVAAVPEPETYGMLLAGLGLIGGIARRRNKTA